MPELRYDIRVGADVSGAPKAEAAIKGVTTASNEANAAASAHAAGAAQMWSGLQQAAMGGTQAIVGLGRAIGGAFQAAMGAVPIAKWIAMAGQLVAVLGTVLGAVGLFRKAADDTKKPVDDLTAAQDASKRSAEALAKAYSADLSSALKSIASDAAEAISWQKQLAAANEKVAKSVDDKTKAEIQLKKSRGEISDAQATTQLAGVDASAEARQAKSRVEAIRIERDEMQKALNRAQSVAETPRAALESLLSQRDDAQARQRALVTTKLEYETAGRAAYSFKNAFGVPWMEVGAQGGEEETKKFEAARSRYEAASSAYAQALNAVPDDESMQALDTALTQAWRDWTAASAPVQELKKKTDELTKTLDLRTSTEIKVLQANAGKRAAENAPEISPEQKAKNEADRKAKEDRTVATYQQLGSGVLAESSARGTRQLDAEIWKRAFPNKPFPQSATPGIPSLASPATPAAPNTPPGLGVVPAGTQLPAWQQSPNAAMQLGGGRLPSDLARTGLPGGITSGPSSGYDNKTAEALKGTTTAVKESDTGDTTAKQAEALKAATEEHKNAVQASSEATVQALTDSANAQQQAAAAVAQTQAEVVAKLGEVVSAQNSLRSEMRSLAAMVRSQRVTA